MLAFSRLSFKFLPILRKEVQNTLDDIRAEGKTQYMIRNIAQTSSQMTSTPMVIVGIFLIGSLESSLVYIPS